MTKFHGYTNEEANKKKVISNVRVKDDQYFRSGDLLSRDSRGYYYFVDRVGDTFRWKGENVSTAEVAQVVSLFPGMTEVNVYGVQLPGKDGRACMAACVMADNVDFKGLSRFLSKELPSYAVPMFLRKLPQIDITGTFKHQKVALRDAGCNPEKIEDPIWWLNPATKTYEPFDAPAWNSIVAGKAKL